MFDIQDIVDADRGVNAHSAGIGGALLMRMLDEIDYGLLLVDMAGALRYANQLGLHEVLGGGPLCLRKGVLHAAAASDQERLRLALADVQRGRRRLFIAGHDGGGVSVAAVPMSTDEGDAQTEVLALLVFGKRETTGQLTVDFFARTNRLTGAESVVLKSICDGRRPKEIARDQGVAISTVRSHICSIRLKTQTGSIGELVNRVAVLPPITPLMKAGMHRLPAHELVAALH